MNPEEKKRAKKYFNIKKDISDEDIQEFLDEEVHICKSHEASDINNRGYSAQLEYLGI